MTWEIYIDQTHPALSADKMSLTYVTEDIVKEEQTMLTFPLTAPGVFCINTEDLATVVGKLQLFLPAHVITRIKRADIPVATSIPFESVTVSTKQTEP